jgi:hypothetical protein
MSKHLTADDIVRWLRPVVDPGTVVELRILKVIENPQYPPFTVSGYFNYESLDRLAEIAMEWTGKAEGCFVTINPVREDLLARAANRVIKRPKHTTTDTEILRRTGLVIDADPVRPAGISTTQEEKELARSRLNQVVSELIRRGWPLPIVADSGNGYHARYRIDLPSDDGGLVAQVLRAADRKFSDDLVKIDAALFNASRIIKLYGTVSRKGDPTDTRRHRWSHVIREPDEFRPVPPELLESFAAEAQPSANGQPRPLVRASVDHGEGGFLPGHDFEKRATWEDILEPHGWAKDLVVGGETRWTRPGKDGGTSATTGHNAGLHVFTSSALPFEPNGNYSKFAAYTLLNYGGDFGAATKSLAAQGYGSRPTSRSRASDNGKAHTDLKWPAFPIGMCVMCTDRDPHNFGYVIADDGDQARIRWESPSGQTEIGILHKSYLRRQDGSALVADDSRELVLVTSRASDIRPVPVTFLDGGVFPAGKLVTLAGLGGSGKGMFWANMVADLTRGRTTLGLSYQPLLPIDVLLIGCEDGYSDTVIPRLLAADADLHRVHILDGVRDPLGHRLPFSLDHLNPLTNYLTACREIRLVIIDPIAGYVGRAGVKDHHDTDVRFLLEPLGELANQCGTTILTVKHLNKDEAKTVASRVGGSVAYVNVPRACFVVAMDPNDEKRRILAPFKWNLNSPMPPAVAWTMEPPPPDRLAAVLANCDHLTDEDREKLAGQLYRLDWVGKVDGFADDLLRSSARAAKKASQDEMDRAEEWLRKCLEKGPVGSIICARDGDQELKRRWPSPTLPIEKRRQMVLGRVKWWRENILKARLRGSVQKLGFRPSIWFFCQPGLAWPPSDEAISAARQAQEAEGTEEAVAAEEVTSERQVPSEALSDWTWASTTQEASDEVATHQEASSASSMDWEEGDL